MRLKLMLSLVAAGALAACADSQEVNRAPATLPEAPPLPAPSTPTTPVEPGQPDGLSGSICDTLALGQIPASDAFFRTFETDEDAATYMRAAITAGALTSTSGASATFTEISTDEKLNTLLGEVVEGYRRAFPLELEGVTNAPRIAVVQASSVKATTIAPRVETEGEAARAPWLLVVHSGLIANGNTDNELRGIFARELAALVLRTSVPEVAARLEKHYVVPFDVTEPILGAQQTNDADVAAHIASLRPLQARLGGVPELGLSVQAGGYAVAMRELLAANVSGCRQASSARNALETLQKGFQTKLATGDATPRELTAEETEQLATAEALFRTRFLDCTLNDRRPLAAAVASMLGLEAAAVEEGHPQHETLVAGMLSNEVAIDANDELASLGARLLAAAEELRPTLVALRAEEKFPIAQLRVFDHQENADDASVRVLAALEQEPTGFGNFLLTSMPEVDRTACLAAVEAKTVSYGGLVEAQPSTCWRYLHVTQFATALNVCEAPASGAEPVSAVALPAAP